jgi:hypothetical protein
MRTVLTKGPLLASNLGQHLPWASLGDKLVPAQVVRKKFIPLFLNEQKKLYTSISSLTNYRISYLFVL